ncbi:dolichyl-phosphate beta-glucosyltransferase-like isoform X1 [Phoenix dactylifera]|uniref:dolichyl-phosphate beta-glucosyltransferase n=1 Tax=Phoenix dactylifera TaxID=42345 RepID=A0A8B7CN42_PHODC|nr:dolichyl-phosphate beta-glucosyltransferase-like isoform X1 [Phoenix dactylifera]
MGWWSLFPDPHLALSLFLSSLALILALGIAAFFLEYVRKIGCKHSLERTAALDAFFEDPNSLKKVPCPSIFDPAEKYLSLIVPAYNEEHRLPGALIETINYLQQRSAVEKSFSYEVLIVDDGSTDRTSQVAFDFVRKYKIDNVRVILLGRNHGKGEAIRKGMLHSRGELLLMLDADGATKVTDLEKLETQIRALAKKDKDNLSAAMPNGLSLKLSDIEVAAFGSRAHLEKQALATRKWYRNLLMKGFHLVVLLTAGPGIRDTQCGFKMFTRAAARKLFTNIRLKRWCFDVELVYLCKHLGIPMIEVSVTWSEIPGSKVRMTSIMHMLFELILIRLGYGLGIWKIYT